MSKANQPKPAAWRAGVIRVITAGVAAVGVLALAACSDFSFGPNSGISTRTVGVGEVLPTAAGETLGSGPVRVAVILPLSGPIAPVGGSMANGAKLAMDFITSSANISDNITLVIKDSAGDATTAAQKAREAVAEGAKLILGPLKAEAVTSAGAVARSAGVPMIAFSNNSGAASAGVYLLNVLPEVEVRRSLTYAKSQGRKSFAAILPTNDFGRIQEGAFRQAVSDLGLNARALYTFSNETEARQAIEQALPLLQSGTIDALFLPDRATAPSFGVLLETAGVQKSALTIIGSADWDGDTTITQTPFLAGAVYPAVDPAGQAALAPQYQARFGTQPHAFTTIAYTAVLLANSATLSQATPPYDRGQLTRSSGFNGRDGLFRFLPDGRSEYALIMKQVVIGGSQQVDGPKLP